jgi:NADH dehydrogenase (ubiquinone) 1 alpha subcomplex subunit 10
VLRRRNKGYDEKKFAQDPTGQSGGLDRMLYQSYMGRYAQYLESLAVIFNTGQGVVTERSPHSDWVYIEAAYRQGWISRTTRQMYHKVRELTIKELLRPNMIIYLDAPVDVVQSKIRARAQTTHPWEKNSPVWGNTDYMNSLYTDLYKKQYLQEAGLHSYVLSYDWSEGGDAEVVAEDIERINMDYHEKYDKQQGDWRLLTEDNFSQKRFNYSGSQKWRLLGAVG